MNNGAIRSWRILCLLSPGMAEFRSNASFISTGMRKLTGRSVVGARSTANGEDSSNSASRLENFSP